MSRICCHRRTGCSSHMNTQFLVLKWVENHGETASKGEISSQSKAQTFFLQLTCHVRSTIQTLYVPLVPDSCHWPVDDAVPAICRPSIPRKGPVNTILGTSTPTCSRVLQIRDHRELLAAQSTLYGVPIKGIAHKSAHERASVEYSLKLVGEPREPCLTSQYIHIPELDGQRIFRQS